MPPEVDQPLFSDVAEALRFALNAAQADMPRPFMNKAMAEAPTKKLSKKKQAEFDALVGARSERIKQSQLYPRAHFKGMDKAGQAGFILAKLELLAPEQSTVLKGLLTTAYDPCACRAPCCVGRRPNPRWLVAVKLMCHILKETGDVIKKPGSRGLSTQPDLRKAIVEEWFTGEQASMANMARRFGISSLTVAKHKEWITTYLEQTENEAWQQIAPILDQAGITGAIL